jgi:hypothetical protein
MRFIISLLLCFLLTGCATPVSRPTHLIETFDLDPDVETIVDVFDGAGVFIASDDNTAPNSRIEFRPSRSGTYYLRILNIGVANFGESYRVRVVVKP